jgi:hypothetical protein
LSAWDRADCVRQSPQPAFHCSRSRARPTGEPFEEAAIVTWTFQKPAVSDPRGRSAEQPLSPEWPLAPACVASPDLRRAPNGACAAWQVRRTCESASLRLPRASSVRPRRVRDPRGWLPPRHNGPRVGPPAVLRSPPPGPARSGPPAMSAADVTLCAALIGECPAPGTAGHRSPFRTAGRRPPRNQTVDRSRLNQASRATDTRCCQSRCASLFGSTTTPWRSRNRGP